MKPRIVHLVQSLETGGAEKLLADLALHCSKQYDVTVISQYARGKYPIEALLEDHGVPVLYMNKKKGFDIHNFVQVYRLFNSLHPDVVHTHLHAAIYAIPWYITHKKAVKVHTIHSMAKMEFGRVHRLLQRFAYKFCGVIPVAITPAVKESVLQEYKLPQSRVPLIFNGINFEKYALPRQIRDPSLPVRLIQVASFSKWKNQRYLLSSFRKALQSGGQLTLTFVGEGPEKAGVESLSRELLLQEQVHFAGISDKVEEYLNQSDIFVLCSTFEGLPLSLLEAYAAGLPVIATRVGGIPDVLTEGENGLLVPSQDETAMVQAIRTLSRDPALRQKMGEANREKAKQFDMQLTVKKYIYIYNLQNGEDDV